MRFPPVPRLGVCALRAALLWPLTAFLLSQTRAANLESGGLRIALDPSGSYQLVAAAADWTLAGKLPGPATDLRVADGTDAVGPWRQLAFAWQDGGQDLTGFIRLYEKNGLLLFSDTLVRASAKAAAPFPDFTSLPPGWFPFSYQDRNFSPPQFGLGNATSSPWLFFDAQDHALLLSPAAHFTVATLTGDGRSRLSSAFLPTLAGLPAGWTRQTLLAFGTGINATFDAWGHALTDLQGKPRPANDADASLKYYGYWTDNGARYYYHYDLSRGYQGTLQQLIDTYRQEKIPLRYLQLDSWWYHKTFTSPAGQPGHAMNARLPEGDWNRYGGTVEYTASNAVFPQGLAAFQSATGLPLITHNRWIDPASPYNQRFKISGLAAVDPAFWHEIAAYLKASGVATYEQDWLSEIFPHSPELSSTPDLGDAFLDGMANACRDQGLTLQYCMALPRCFLQGSKYGNLTTIRTSDDRFLPARYHDFLYVSRFATALGIWPWCDVFMSGETNNLLLSNLSAGPVGTGDLIGQENRANLFKTIRADGVIIKPDTSVVPVDSAYLAEAQKQPIPLVSTAHTDHTGHRTLYALVVNPPKAPAAPFTLTPADLGTPGPVCVYDHFAGTARWLQRGDIYTGQVPADGVSYLVVAPVGASGVAFLGDSGKFVSMGRQRIASMHDLPDRLAATVLLTPDEDAVTLHGYCHGKPAATVTQGTAEPVGYDPATGHFTVVVHPDASATLTPAPDPVRQVEVTFTHAVP